MSSVADRLQEVARAVFDDDELMLKPSTTANDVPAWDSLGHINFMYAVEQEFRVEFTDEEFANFVDVGALETILERKVDPTSIACDVIASAPDRGTSLESSSG
jgi:acyl carrier protein